MELSIFFAKMFAIYFIIVSLGIMFNSKKISHMVEGFRKNAGLTYSIGGLALLLGSALVVVHNVWEGWPIIITIIAWITLIKGAMIFLVPDSFLRFAKTMSKNNGTYFTLSFIVLIFGLILGYLGFLA